MLRVFSGPPTSLQSSLPPSPREACAATAQGPEDSEEASGQDSKRSSGYAPKKKEFPDGWSHLVSRVTI